MSANTLKDRPLKKAVKEILENCQPQNLIIDREVQLNRTGEKDAQGHLIVDMEIDIVAIVEYSGKRILLLFECKDVSTAQGLRKTCREYKDVAGEILEDEGSVKVVTSMDDVLRTHHLRDIDHANTCLVFGPGMSAMKLNTARSVADQFAFPVWDSLALTYYGKMSPILKNWCLFEIFKDFSFSLEGVLTIRIPALELKQKGKTMYVGTIHPGQLLRIGYVVRRASQKKYAYQRMLSKDRIDAISRFISSPDSESFLPNAVLLAFDAEVERHQLKYHPRNAELELPMKYCSAWIIDGQHRAYGFLGTQYERWSQDSFRPFDLPVVIVKNLSEKLQTQTFININYYQKRIKSGLLCDLSTITKDMNYKLTWPSLLSEWLNEEPNSPVKDRIAVSELHRGRPINISSFVQYGLLETLLGFHPKSKSYTGPLYTLAPFDISESFDSEVNQKAFKKQADILFRFLTAVSVNTKADLWQDWKHYSLLKPTGINALFMLLGKILQKFPKGTLDFETYLTPLANVQFERDHVFSQGGGWKGFRNFANTMIRAVNKDQTKQNELELYRKKQKL